MVSIPDPIPRETFSTKTPEDKLNSLYDLALYYNAVHEKHFAKHDAAIDKLKRGRRLDKLWAFSGGTLGGFLAFIGKGLIGK